MNWLFISIYFYYFAYLTISNRTIVPDQDQDNKEIRFIQKWNWKQKQKQKKTNDFDLMLWKPYFLKLFIGANDDDTRRQEIVHRWAQNKTKMIPNTAVHTKTEFI